MRGKYYNHILIIVFGTIMSVGVLLKLFFDFDIDSDWFWFLAGVGIIMEGVVTYRKQKKFDRKYRIIER